MATTARSWSRTPTATAMPHTSALLDGRREGARQYSRQAGAESWIREDVVEPAPPCVAHATSHRLVGQQPRERAGNRLGILARHEQAGLAIDDHVGGRIVPGAEARNTGAHRLEIDQPEPFTATRHREDGG